MEPIILTDPAISQITIHFKYAFAEKPLSLEECSLYFNPIATIISSVVIPATIHTTKYTKAGQNEHRNGGNHIVHWLGFPYMDKVFVVIDRL